MHRTPGRRSHLVRTQGLPGDAPGFSGFPTGKYEAARVVGDSRRGRHGDVEPY